jgi:hypothetical protein
VFGFCGCRGRPPGPRHRQSVKILIDAQLPPSLKVRLAEAGREPLHIVDVGLRDADDAQFGDTLFGKGPPSDR